MTWQIGCKIWWWVIPSSERFRNGRQHFIKCRVKGLNLKSRETTKAISPKWSYCNSHFVILLNLSIPSLHIVESCWIYFSPILMQYMRRIEKEVPWWLKGVICMYTFEILEYIYIYALLLDGTLHNCSDFTRNQP